MSSSPNPSSLTLLESLGQFPPYSKVRFLGCVESYDIRSAVVTLTHKTLHSPSSNSSTIWKARVDIGCLVYTIAADVLQDGEWVNVIGYVMAEPSPTDANRKPREPGVVYVQGISIWSAGAIDPGYYESSLRAKLAIDQKISNELALLAEHA